jgi:hypothetical protein
MKLRTLGYLICKRQTISLEKSIAQCHITFTPNYAAYKSIAELDVTLKCIEDARRIVLSWGIKDDGCNFKNSARIEFTCVPLNEVTEETCVGMMNEERLKQASLQEQLRQLFERTSFHPDRIHFCTEGQVQECLKSLAEAEVSLNTLKDNQLLQYIKVNASFHEQIKYLQTRFKPTKALFHSADECNEALRSIEECTKLVEKQNNSEYITSKTFSGRKALCRQGFPFCQALTHIMSISDDNWESRSCELCSSSIKGHYWRCSTCCSSISNYCFSCVPRISFYDLQCPKREQSTESHVMDCLLGNSSDSSNGNNDSIKCGRCHRTNIQQDAEYYRCTLHGTSLCLQCAYNEMARIKSPTLFALNLQFPNKPNEVFLPNELDSHRSPQLGVKVSFLQEFVDACGGKEVIANFTISEVCEIFVTPFTKSCKLSLCDLLYQSNHTGVGKASVFICHTYNGKFMDLVDGLQRQFAGAEDTVIWLDVFSVNQHPSVPKGFYWWFETFQQAIEQCGHTVMVLSPWYDPVQLKRTWCLWEMYCTVSSGKTLDIVFSEKDEVEFCREISDKSLNLLKFKIDVENSSCNYSGAHSNIISAIKKKTTIDDFNRLLRATLTEILLAKQKAVYLQLAAELDMLNNRKVFSIADMALLVSEADRKHCLHSLEQAAKDISKWKLELQGEEQVLHFQAVANSNNDNIFFADAVFLLKVDTHGKMTVLKKQDPSTTIADWKHVTTFNANLCVQEIDLLTVGSAINTFLGEGKKECV